MVFANQRPGSLLRGPVGNNINSDEHDIRLVRGFLNELDFDTGNPNLGFMDKKLDDGLINPDGETEQTMRKKFFEKRHQDKREPIALKPPLFSNPFSRLNENQDTEERESEKRDGKDGEDKIPEPLPKKKPKPDAKEESPRKDEENSPEQKEEKEKRARCRQIRNILVSIRTQKQTTTDMLENAQKKQVQAAKSLENAKSEYNRALSDAALSAASGIGSNFIRKPRFSLPGIAVDIFSETVHNFPAVKKALDQLNAAKEKKAKIDQDIENIINTLRSLEQEENDATAEANSLNCG